MFLRKVGAFLLSGALLNPAILFAAPQPHSTTATPIKHLVVIFGENISFDHYFGSYPSALNLQGENPFFAQPGTPTVNGLSPALLNHNPNLNPANNASCVNCDGTPPSAGNPFRLAPSQASTADQDHNYTPEQQAFDAGLLDLFPEYTGTGGNAAGSTTVPNVPPAYNTSALTLGYYDGNTVTGYWNYAQHFALNDNMFGSTFGPSTPGAIEVISGQTNGVINNAGGSGNIISDGNGGFTDIDDADPAGDVCSTTTKERFNLSGKNIGDLLTAAGVSWGWFNGGFNLSVVNPNNSTGCTRNTTSTVTGVNHADYVPHHEPFQYYESTQNWAHTPPASVSEVGNAGPANHQYDVNDFFNAVSAGNFPAVSYLKAPAYQDAHAGYSDPIDEQNFVVNVVNFLQQQPEWSSTAVIVTYDDSDGWYDHQAGPIVNQSATSADALSGPGLCGTSSATTALPGVNPATTNAQGRCGYGPRLPFLVISPWAKANFVDHTQIDQSSVVRFIEDNWLGGERIGGGSFDQIAGSIQNMFDFSQPFPRQDRLFLSYSTGEPVRVFPGWPARFPFWGW
jgi:phospholipase C